MTVSKSCPVRQAAKCIFFSLVEQKNSDCSRLLSWWMKFSLWFCSLIRELHCTYTNYQKSKISSEGVWVLHGNSSTSSTSKDVCMSGYDAPSLRVLQEPTQVGGTLNPFLSVLSPASFHSTHTLLQSPWAWFSSMQN